MLTVVRIVTLHLLLLGCFVLISIQLFLSLTTYGWDKDSVTKIVFITAIVTTCLGAIVQLIVAPLLALRDYTFKYWNTSTFLFIVFSMAPYGIGFHYTHINERASMDNATSLTTSFAPSTMMTGKDQIACSTLENDLFAFITYLLPLPILIFCDVLYPRPTDKYPNSNKISIVNSFAMLDILDLAVLIFADAGCFHDYHTGWTIFYYTSLALAVLLMTFSYGLEQQKDITDEDSTIDMWFTILNLVFKDMTFLILRSYKAYQQKHVYIDAIFMAKEVSAIILRSSLAFGVYFCL